MALDDRFSLLHTDGLGELSREAWPCTFAFRMRWRSFVRGASAPSYLWVQVRDGGLTVCLMPGRLLVGDTTPTVPVVVVPFTSIESGI
ncbi:hypothetical protein EVAR_39763_1 [Eumeta japonica]|uniref:Uncharacterized protein n=1 Tax=Eumeta variegata TaxID=151549 RepID=A0A4C1X6Z4_EUMVA|nr:hypothetical protein EVAR_39763_1 [Eumeta japonica]